MPPGQLGRSGPDSERDSGDAVRAAWTDAATQLGGDPAAAAGWADDLVARYREPHRRYHGLAHVAAVVRDAGTVARQVSLHPDERALLALAACAHDVVYEGRARDDEMASAAWAAAALAGVDPGHVDRVTSLVLATIGHTADSGDNVASVLMDADLAILASPDYDHYVSAVRAEYAAFSDEQWRDGRQVVLLELLARQVIYRTGPGQQRWEADARRNIRAELAELDAGPTRG